MARIRVSICKAGTGWIVFLGGTGNLSDSEIRPRSIAAVIRTFKKAMTEGVGDVHIWVRTQAACINNQCNPIVRISSRADDDPSHNAHYIGKFPIAEAKKIAAGYVGML